MNQLILATHNDHKAREFQDILPQYSVKPLQILDMMKRSKKQQQILKGTHYSKPKPFLSVMDMW